MKVTKSRLKQIIKEEVESITEIYDRNLFGDEDREPEAPEESVPEAAAPPEVALMEDLWDMVVRAYKVPGMCKLAHDLQKLLEAADEGHERLMPRGEGTPGLTMPKAPPVGSQDHQRRRFYKNRE